MAGEGVRSFPPFFGGPARAQIISALALHVYLTVPELLKVLGLKSPRTLYRHAGELKVAGLIESFYRKPPGKYCSVPRFQVWTLNRRHPWIYEIRAFARRLAKGMGIPGPSHLGLAKVRAYIGPAPQLGRAKKNAPLRQADRNDLFRIYARKENDLILLLLPHFSFYSDGIPVRKLARLLGLSRSGTGKALDGLLEWEIIRQVWRGSERLVKLNRKFYCYQSLFNLLVRIDRDTGREFQYLVNAYNRPIKRRKISQSWAKKRNAQRSRKRP